MTEGPRIAVVGNMNADLVYRVEGALAPGREILGEALGHRLGGSGANAGSALALAGNRVTLHAQVGRDGPGEEILRQAEAYPWDLSGVTRRDGPTSTCVILIDESGDRTILGLSRRRRAPLPWPALDLGACDALYFAAAREVPPEVASAARRLPVVAQLWSAERLGHAGIVVASEQNFRPDEGRDWWGAVRARGIAAQALVVTLGAAGAWATDGTQTWEIPAQPTRVVDTTGAGDAFAAGLVHAAARGWRLPDALALANLWGAAAVGHLGSTFPADQVPPLEMRAALATLSHKVQASFTQGTCS